MFTDLRYVLRSLAGAKGFTAVTVLTLALGIGSAAAIFSVVDWMLFRSMSYPADLVVLGSRTKQSDFIGVTFAPQIAAYAALDGVFAEIAIAKRETVNVVVRGEPVMSGVMRVSPGFLPLVGAVPARGRGFLVDEGVDGKNDVVVITEDFGREFFPEEGDVIGRHITVDQRVCTIVGVLAPRQVLPFAVYGRVFRPTSVRSDPATAWQDWYLSFARLRPGVTPAAAEQAMATVKLSAPVRLKDYLAQQQPRATTVQETQAIKLREVYWVMFGAVGFLYTIACLNATNLMVVRLLGRRRELSIRLALGGSRARLIRLLLLEGAVLAFAAAVAGVLVANWLRPLLGALAGFGKTSDWGHWALDGRAVVVLVALTMLASLVITIVPALRIVRADVQEGLKEGGTMLGETRGLARVRSGLVVLQAAFALILLMGAGLMVRTFERLQAVPMGFELRQRMKVRLSFPPGFRAGNDDRHALLKELQDRLSRVPGVRAASYGTDALLAGYFYAPVAVTLPDGTEIKVKTDNISANFLETSGMRLIRGRMIAENGGEVMISESLAQRRFGQDDPIGHLIHKTKDSGSDASDWLVVGVVGDVRHQLRDEPGYRIYTPETWWSPSIDTYILHVAREPDKQMAAAVKRAIYDFEPKIVISTVAGLDEMRGWYGETENYVTTVLKVLSAFALTLATVGMFSVLAYSVDQRTGEFGVRLALGATSRDLVGLVMGRGMKLAVAGVALGVAGALALARYLQSLLYQTPPHDPVVLVSVGVVLLIAAALACALPARRATKVDIARLLRSE